MLGLECKFSVCRVRPSKYIQHINLSRTCPDASRVIVSLASYVSACGTTNRDRSPHLSSSFGVAEPKKSAGFAFDGALLLVLLPSAPCRMEVSRLHVLDFAAIVMYVTFLFLVSCESSSGNNSVYICEYMCLLSPRIGE